jgi:hypothetical protein
MKNAPELIDPTWERQPGEGAVAYRCFTAYRDMGETRTLERAAQHIISIWPDFMTSRSTALRERTVKNRLGAWSPGWHWVERCVDYDNHLDHVLIAVREKASHDTAHLLEARRIVIEAREAEMSDEATKVIMSALRVGATHPVIVNGVYVGDEVNEAVLRVLPQLIKETRTMGRLSAGMPTEGARMPTPPLDTKEGSDMDEFFRSIGKGGEAAPSRDVPDAVTST